MSRQQVTIDQKFINDVKAGTIKPIVGHGAIRRLNYTEEAVLESIKEGKLLDNLMIIHNRTDEGKDVYRVIPDMGRDLPKRNSGVQQAAAKPKKTEAPEMDAIKLLLEKFPELEEDYKQGNTFIKSANCSSCARRSTINKLLYKLAELVVKYPERTVPKDLEKDLGHVYARHLAYLKYRQTPYGTLAVPMGSDPGKYGLLKPAQHSHATEGVRPSCLDCVRKHLGQAIIVFQESEYPEYANHFWLGIGHLAEMESELLSSYPDFARAIRETRLAMMADRDYLPNLMDLFDWIDDLDKYAPLEEPEKEPEEKKPKKKEAKTKTKKTKK